ncbi:hypothetical protein ACH9D2_10180 [Kocuria sp. M4R2S49]|uniref:GH39 family glycosyl hydrolase n=1 Tax=Kocuria rhizosphaericola TaxID=3376284 RepID=UPI00379BB1FB
MNPDPLPSKRLRMKYGVNQADQCADFAVGPHRNVIGERLREVETGLVRLFLFDKGAPDPVQRWPTFAAYVQAVLDLGATPMITFAKLHRPLDDVRALRWFAGQCSDVVWGCVEQWGAEAVADWYWCVWNEPNSDWVGGGLTFEQYRRIYEAVAEAVAPWLPTARDDRPLRLGGPAVESFQPFWMDWVWRFLNEIDPAIVGFVDWHSYADWRDFGESGAPSDEVSYKALLMSRAADYEWRSRAIAELIGKRPVDNICGELNTHSHYTDEVRGRFNHSVFGAAFYVAALLRLMRTDLDAEMYWTGTEDKGGYGLLRPDGTPAPAFLAKRLCAQHVRTGDWVSFPRWTRPGVPVDAVVAEGADGRRSAVLVHLSDRSAAYALEDLDPSLTHCGIVHRLDEGTGGQVISGRADAKMTFNGYGVAVITTPPAGGT